MRVFKTKWMARFARKSGIADALFLEAARRADRGLIDADLGGGIIKQRIGREGQGRSGGYRTLIAFRSGDRAIFVFAFAKNERDNIGPEELASFRDIAGEWLKLNAQELTEALRVGQLEEIGNDRQV